MKNKFLRGLIGTSIFIAVFGAASTAVMLLWNWLVPQIIGWTAVTFWQAAGLVLLNKLLFGGMGRHCFGMNALRRSGPTFPTWKERAAMRDRIRAMGKEERREYIRRHHPVIQLRHVIHFYTAFQSPAFLYRFIGKGCKRLRIIFILPLINIRH